MTRGAYSIGHRVGRCVTTAHPCVCLSVCHECIGSTATRPLFPPRQTCALFCSNKSYLRFVAIGGFVYGNPYPTAIKPSQIMPEIGQLMYPNTRSRAKHIYTEEEVWSHKG